METQNEKQLRFDTLQALAVNTSEVKSLGRGNGFRQRVIRWLEQKSVFGNHRNIEKGWDITISRKGARSVMAHDAQDGKVALLEHAPTLIKNGIYIDTIHKTNEVDSHIFANKAKIDGELAIIGIVVREDVNGKRYYNHAIQIENGVQAESGIRARNTTARYLPKDPNSILNIVKKHLEVNT